MRAILRPVLDDEAGNAAQAEIDCQRKTDRTGADNEDRTRFLPVSGAGEAMRCGGHIHALARRDKGEHPCARAAANDRRRTKKSPAVRRGKTDSLEISQRGKACIYAKFMTGCKRKMHKKYALIECKI
ncbi:MAG TPA: hypothetical protein VIY51_09625, partial [Xanthobacteraceae bacterium]